MKIKTDFVTNSSSTSFILSKDKNKDDKSIKITIEMTIEDLFKSITQYSIIKDKEDLDEYILRDCYESNKNEIRQKYSELLDKEKEILILSFDSDEGGIQSVIRDNPESIKFEDGIEIITKIEG